MNETLGMNWKKELMDLLKDISESLDEARGPVVKVFTQASGIYTSICKVASQARQKVYRKNITLWVKDLKEVGLDDVAIASIVKKEVDSGYKGTMAIASALTTLANEGIRIAPMLLGGSGIPDLEELLASITPPEQPEEDHE